MVPIDRPISRESSGDPNLMGDQAAHPGVITKITNSNSGATLSSNSRGMDSVSTSPQ